MPAAPPLDPSVDRDVPAADAGLDKSGRTIRDMFAGVAPRYDLLNHLLSASLDIVWRKKAARALAMPDGAAVLDLCCGTGDQAVALAKRGAQVAAADFCVPMLALSQPKFRRFGQRRPRPLAADALALPFPGRRFAGATVSFGLRNVADLDRALAELARVLAPGGKLVVLEFAVPALPPLRALYLFYFRHLLPWIGRLISARGSAYTYLPSSVLQFPQRRGFLDRMAAAGFSDLAWKDLSGGIVCLYSGRIPG
ncbi:MAG TPA: ubiquinone/menaquinone biosynthesis methyltransferase [Thermoanaerobaculia bacterium]|nr:ubiquinone/menaquinone biosynthesis methyltransferase [Thermoanaerobaculia bacterium]